jgi:hypothetical protein
MAELPEVADLVNNYFPTELLHFKAVRHARPARQAQDSAVEADIDDYARAVYGIKSNASAVSMAAATEALDALINSVSRGADVTLGALLRAHNSLMRADEGRQGLRRPDPRRAELDRR